MWAVSLSVCVAGWLIAHSFAYRLVAAGDERSGALVEGSGHGHMTFSPHLMAGSVTVLLLALGVAVAAGATRRARPDVPLAPFALLPLQVPFALLALLLARTTLAWAEGVGRGLTPRWRPRPVAHASPTPPRLLLGSEHRPIIPALASGCAQRGPPAASLGH